MKRIPNFALIACLMFIVGCASLYRGVVTITDVADQTMTELGALSRAGKITPELDAKIGRAHADYVKACAVAELALVAYKESGDSSQHLAALKAVRASIDPLIEILGAFVTQEKTSKLKTQLATAKSL